MASNLKIELKPGAVTQLLKSSEVQSDLRGRAEAIAAAAGPGHRVDSGTGRSRARATVLTDTFQARYHEATTRSLTRAIDAGR